MVPMLRIAGWPITRAVSGSSACAPSSPAAAATSRWEVMAPTPSPPPGSPEIPLSASIWRRLTSADGITRSAFIIATSVAPPARQRASSSAASNATASSTVDGP